MAFGEITFAGEDHGREHGAVKERRGKERDRFVKLNLGSTNLLVPALPTLPNL